VITHRTNLKFEPFPSLQVELIYHKRKSEANNKTFCISFCVIDENCIMHGYREKRRANKARLFKKLSTNKEGINPPFYLFGKPVFSEPVDLPLKSLFMLLWVPGVVVDPPFPVLEV